MQVLDLVHAAEGFSVLGDEIDHLVEPLHERERGARERLDKSRADTVTLGVPLVLLSDCPTDAVKAGIQRAITIKRANKTAKQRGDRDAIVQACATVGDAQFDGWVVEGRPDRPPDVAFVGNDLGPFERRDELAIVVIGAEQLWQSRAWKFIVGGEPVADETGEVALPEW